MKWMPWEDTEKSEILQSDQLSLHKVVVTSTDNVAIKIQILFVWLDSLRPSQQSFSYVVMGLSGLNQY